PTALRLAGAAVDDFEGVDETADEGKAEHQRQIADEGGTRVENPGIQGPEIAPTPTVRARTVHVQTHSSRQTSAVAPLARIAESLLVDDGDETEHSRGDQHDQRPDEPKPGTAEEGHEGMNGVAAPRFRESDRQEQIQEGLLL